MLQYFWESSSKMDAVTAVFTLCIWADSEDSDQMPQEEVCDQGPHYLPFIQQFLDSSM